MNYEKMSKAELIKELKSVESNVKFDSRRQIEKKFMMLSWAVEQSPCTILITDIEGNIEFANPMFTKLTGYTLDEAIGKNPSILSSGKTPVELYKDLWAKITAGIEWSGEFCNKKKNGEIYWEFARISPIKNSEGIITNFIGVKEDITERKQIENDLKNSEARYRDIASSMSDWIWEVDIHGKYTYCAGNIKEILNYDSEDLLGKTPFDLMPPGEAERVAEIFAEISEKKEPIVDLENWNITRDGRDICLLTNGVPMLDNEGKLLGYRGVDKDITAYKELEVNLKACNESLEQRVLERTEDLLKANKKIKNSEAVFRSILSSLYEAAIVVFDRDGKILSLWGTPEMDKRYGISAVDAVGMSMGEFISPERLEKFIARICQIIDTGIKSIDEYMVSFPRGNFWHETSFSPMYNSEGKFVAVVGFVRDVTERRKTMVALQESKSLHAMVQKIAHLGHWEWNISDNTIKWSDEQYNIFGYEPGGIEPTLNHFLKAVHPRDYKRVASEATMALEGSAPYKSEFTIIRPDGTERDIMAQGEVLRDDFGNPIKMFGTNLDITEYKQIENKLRVNNSYLNLLKISAVASNEAVEIKDAFQPILAQICNYTGWEIGHAYLISNDDPDLLEPTRIWYIQDTKEFPGFRKVTEAISFTKGTGLPGRVMSSSKPHWIVDVVKDKGFLRANIAKNLNIKSGIAFPVMVCSKVVAVIEFFTTKAVEPDRTFMDIMAEVGTQLGRVVERIQADDKIRNLAKFPSENPNPVMRVFNDGRILYSNQPGTALLNYWDPQTKKILPNSYLKIVSNVLHSGLSEVVDIECCKRVFSLTFAPVIEEGYVNIYGLDITKHKQLEMSLIQSEKFKALGIMASGVAHEFNNILTVISNNAQLLKEAHSGNIDLREVLSVICRMVDNGSEIIDRMYAFIDIKKDISQYINTDLNDLIKQVIDFTRPRWKEMAHATGIIYHIDQNASKTLPAVWGNPSEIRGVLLNIVNNALDAMPNGGRVSFRAWNNKNSVFVAISDTGNGMSEDVSKRMFDPFFTTKSPNGTGLGMSVSYGIVKRHGGTIDIESEIGKGSTITLSLPLFRKSHQHVVTPLQTRKVKSNEPEYPAD